MATVLGMRSSSFATPAIPRVVPVHIIARISLGILYYLSLSNLLLLVSLHNERTENQAVEVSAYPIAFAVFGILAWGFSAPRRGGLLLTMSWVVSFIYILGGFIGEKQLTVASLFYVAENTIKPWMTIVGLPWLTVRVISEDQLPKLMKGTVIVTAALCGLAVGQAAIPGFLEFVLQHGSRVAALYFNPNHMGFMAASVLFISLMCPFKRIGLNWICRILLITGVTLSLSRSAIICVPIGWIVFGIASGRVGTLLKSVVLCIGAVALILAAIGLIEATADEQLKTRFASIRGLLTGDFSEESVEDNRTELWTESIRQITKGNAIFGMGHGSMHSVAFGIQPHNYYIFVWGNSGLLALMSVIVYHGMFFTEAFKCVKPEVRAGVLALATINFVSSMLDHSLVGRPYPGCIIAIMILAVLYGRRPLQPSRAVPMLVRQTVARPRP